jgi:anaphase-promoting complex subunit 1
MAEVCLNQISRRDIVQPDLSNEHREAYTYASVLAFGLIVLGKGTLATIPADLGLLKQLSTVIHGDANRVLGGWTTKPLNIYLTSPATSIALGLTHLRTDRKDIVDILTIPDTVLSLGAINPTFLLIRTIARSLILWDSITNERLMHQVPPAIQ